MDSNSAANLIPVPGTELMVLMVLPIILAEVLEELEGRATRSALSLVAMAVTVGQELLQRNPLAHSRSARYP